MVSSTKPSAIAAEDRVRAVAYALWLEEGRPEGRAEAHWFRAMELVDTGPADAPAPAPGRKAPAAAARKAVPAKRAPARKS